VPKADQTFDIATLNFIICDPAQLSDAVLCGNTDDTGVVEAVRIFVALLRILRQRGNLLRFWKEAKDLAG
jgi:hypothetical protein